MAAIHPHDSLVTVPFDLRSGEGEWIRGCGSAQLREPAFDLAVIELDDEGELACRPQLERTAELIRFRRHGEFSEHGVVVVVFVHGWHHGAAWDDEHLIAFRRVLRALAVREMERPDSRRVIGIYVAWQGDPPGYWFRRTPLLKEFSFFGRYRAAERISQGSGLKETLKTITVGTKAPEPGIIPGQLVLVGHSMGGLIVESCLRRLIDGKDLLQDGQAVGRWHVTTHIDGRPVVFPDAVLSVNSAADSRICSAIGELLRERNVSKSAQSGSVSYAPPLLISVTSTADATTGLLWRMANRWRRTTGHDQALITHDFQGEEKTIEVVQKVGPDFGQSFHVLRMPDPVHSKTPRMQVDLPVRDRTGTDDHPPHRPYRLVPRKPEHEELRIWNFQLPPELVKDHGDIFNPRASSLLLALMQISGTVGSLAHDWESSFEPY